MKLVSVLLVHTHTRVVRSSNGPLSAAGIGMKSLERKQMEIRALVSYAIRLFMQQALLCFVSFFSGQSLKKTNKKKTRML